MKIFDKVFDVIIIGGGPAGISAAVWCVDLGLSFVLFETMPKVGGQLAKINAPIINYPGVFARDGREMCDKFRESLVKASAFIKCNENVASFDPDTMSVTTEAGNKYFAKTIVIATGVRRRTLDVVGENAFVGRGILESGVGSKDLIKGKHVLIVGGGDAALENAEILSKSASHLTLVHRRESFSARPEFVEKISAASNVKVIAHANVISINGSEFVESVTLVESKSNVESTIPVDAVLIRIGVVPNTDLFAETIDADGDGYIIVDRSCQTNRACVFAVGDISNKTGPTIAGAVGDAATAIKTAYSLLAAS